MLKIVLIVCCIAVMAANGIVCFNGLTDPWSSEVMESKICEEDDRCTLFQFGITRKSSQQTRLLEIGRCTQEAICPSFKCSALISTIGPLLADRPQYYVSACRVKCCSGNLCNRPGETYPQASPTVIVAEPPPRPAMKCWSGTWTDGRQHDGILPSKHVKTCLSPTEICFISMVSSIVRGSTVTVNSADCMELEPCKYLNCDDIRDSQISSGVRFLSCHMTCCHGVNFCNTPEEQFPGMNIISTSTDSAVVLADERIRCYNGSWTSTTATRKVKTCKIDEMCLIVRIQREVSGVNYTDDIGSCIKRDSCSKITCGSYIPQTPITGMTSATCEIACCESNLCNAPERMFGSATTNSATTEESTCTLRKRNHDACCGSSSYNSNNTSCCEGIRRSKIYNKWRRGCCSGVVYKTVKRNCMDGTLSKLKKGRKKAKTNIRRVPRLI